VDWTLVTLQLRGKARRFVQANVVRQDTEALLARRHGECNRCGACCKIAFRCPFLKTDQNGDSSCRIYGLRFTQCRLYPLHASDLLELKGQCSYTFETAPERPEIGALPQPALD
jgi:Fe-S-cluster containining protein